MFLISLHSWGGAHSQSEDSHIDQEKAWTIVWPCSEAPSLYLQDNTFLTNMSFAKLHNTWTRNYCFGIYIALNTDKRVNIVSDIASTLILRKPRKTLKNTKIFIGILQLSVRSWKWNNLLVLVLWKQAICITENIIIKIISHEFKVLKYLNFNTLYLMYIMSLLRFSF